MSALSYVYSDRGGGAARRHARLSDYRQTLAALAVSAVAGLAIFATASGSLMQGAAAAPPTVNSPPPGWIDLAFADVDAASTGSAIHSQQAPATQSQNTPKQDSRKQDTRKRAPCADFVYFFLNTNCSLKRVGSARGFAHRAVAARTVPAPSKQAAAPNSERLTLAATTTTAAD
jgi:hypothetical protein